MCIVLVAQVGAQVSNNGFVGSNSFWKSSKPIQNGKDFFHCWSFHYILEVLVANWPPRINYFCEQNWPNDPRIECFKHFDVLGDLVGACMTKSNLVEELDAKFKGEIEQEEFSNLCDFLVWKLFV